MMTQSTIGYTLRTTRQIREHNGVKLADLAAELGISKEQAHGIDGHAPDVKTLLALQACINRNADAPKHVKPHQLLITRSYRPFADVSLPVTRVTLIDPNEGMHVWQELVPCERYTTGTPGEDFKVCHRPHRERLDAIIASFKAEHPDLIVRDNAR